MMNLVSLFGFFAILGVAWLLSENRNSVSLRVVGWSVLIQFLLAALIFWFEPGRQLFLGLNDFVNVLLENARRGSEFLFGDLALPPGSLGSKGFYFAFQALPTVIFFSAGTGLLYFLGVLPWLVRSFARVFSKTMGTSGAESLAVASNVFVGIESALLTKPYLEKMTRSELATLLTAGMGTIASTVLGLYVIMLQPTFPSIAGHLISASLLSAPAAMLMAKLLVPETGLPETAKVDAELSMEPAKNWIDAVTKSAMDGLQLAFGIGAVLVAFLGLLALLNSALGWSGGFLGFPDLKLESLLAFVYYPFAWLLGIPSADVPAAATLLGLRTVATEVPAYQQLAELLSSGQISDPRTAVILAYALCGFAHIPSLGVFIGGISALAPSQRAELGSLALRCLAGATLCCLSTGALAGVFFLGGEGLLLK